MTKTFGEQSTTDEVLEGVDLHGKRILVTGASAGLGVETALAAAVVEAARASASGRLVLTGGDGALLRQPVTLALERLGIVVDHKPLLGLQSLALLRPGA